MELFNQSNIVYEILKNSDDKILLKNSKVNKLFNYISNIIFKSRCPDECSFVIADSNKLKYFKSKKLIRLKLKLFPKWNLLNLYNLEHLDFNYFNFIENIPSEIDCLNLKILEISDHRDIYISSNLYNLINLNRLKLSDCSIYELPDNINNLVNLEELYFHNNQMEILPENFKGLKKLEILSITYNNIFDIKSICSLTNLRQLNLETNNIEKIPNDIIKLQFLSKLNLSHNYITYIPDSLKELQNLRDLNLFSNSITRIPVQLCEINDLELDISENYIEYIPKEFNYSTVTIYNYTNYGNRKICFGDYL